MATVRVKGVNPRYFKHILQDRKISTRKLAKLLDMHQASLIRAFQGKIPLKANQAATMSALLNVPLEDILHNLAIEVPVMRPKGGNKVPVTGSVINAKVVTGKATGPRTVVAPPGGGPSAGMQALRCTDEGVLDGAYLYYRPAAEVQPRAIGRLSVCTVAGGDTFVATPRPAASGTYTLRDFAGRVVADSVWLESAAPIVWVKTA